MAREPTGETKDLRTSVVEAMQAFDPETAWYLDRRKLRVVSVRHGVVSDPLLHAGDVEDDETRFVEVPAVTEAEVHEWMDEFVDAAAVPEVAACLDEKAGANARFVEKLARRFPEQLTAWNRFRHERVGGVADAWCARILAEPLPGDGVGLVSDD